MIVALVCLCLTGCGTKPKNEKQISKDIIQKSVLPGSDSAHITDLEILQRQTDEGARQDLVYVQLEGKFQKLDYTRQYKLTYEYFEEGGWILQALVPYHIEEWTIQCPDQDDLKRDLENPTALELDGFLVADVELTGAVPNADQTGCTVFATVQGQNEYAKATFSISAGYALTDDGWEYLQSEIDHNQSVVTVFAGIPAGSVLADAETLFGYKGSYTITSTQDDFENSTQTIHLHYQSNEEYLNIFRDVQVVYTFDPAQMQWVAGTSDILNTTYQLNINASLFGSETDSGMSGDFSCSLTLDMGVLDDSNIYRVISLLKGPLGSIMDKLLESLKE